MSSLTRVSGTPFINPTSTADSGLNLDAIRDARCNINEIRLLLKGNVEACHKLFREAVEVRDVVSQIQLSHAHFGIKWGKDHEKDFSSLTIHDLEEFSYYPREFDLFNSVYDEAMGVKADWKTHEAKGIETFSLAADQGYLPAVLELKATQWKWNSNSYGFAVQLRPFVGKGDKQLDYYFGKALKNGSQIGSELYYEGLCWVENSCGIPVKYPKEDQSFKDFKSHYIRFEDVGSTSYDHDGFLHVGPSVVLAPSREAWEIFKREKLADVKIAKLDSYMFKHDSEQIKSLADQYKIGMVVFDGTSKHGFVSVYEDHVKIGEISVSEDVREMHQTINDKRIQPIIEFIENVIIRSGSARSAHSWLSQMGCYYL